MAEPPRTTRNRGVWWRVGLLLLVPIVMPLLVPLYARNEPSLFGFPFYYWYQFLWIILAATLTTVAFRVVSAQERRDRERRDSGEEGSR
ncbi:MAG: DUF3311 domain-containing protein [Nocardioidaceae bacterium]